MATIEEQREYLENMILDLLKVDNDEMEGQQAISLDDINLCSSDYNEIDPPELTQDEINRRFHFNDKNIFPHTDTSGDSKDNSGNDIDKSGKFPTTSIINNSDTERPYNRPFDKETGQTSPGGDPSESGIDDTDKTDSESAEPTVYDNSVIPNDANLDDITTAILDDDTVGSNKAIIEFATPSLQNPQGVDYTLFVKPGESITSDTIIGTVTINGVQKKIRSIFSAGTVLANDAGTDFKHLYEKAGAKRHIIIDNFSYGGDAPDIDLDMINAIQDKFKAEAQLHQLITDNLCESLLPWILTRRHTEYKYKSIAIIPIREERPNGQELFAKYLEYVNNIRKKYSEDISKIGTVENIKATNGNTESVNKLGYSIIDRRHQYYKDILYAYEEYRNTIDLCEYDSDYDDCKYLAYEHSIKFLDKHTENKYTRIADYDYNNYYMAILSKMDLNTDNKYAKRYYNLIKKIIETRISLEHYSIDTISKEFDSKFNSIVNRTLANPFRQIDNVMKGIARTKELEYSDIIGWITEHQNKAQADDYTQYGIQQLSNIYMFCYSYKQSEQYVYTNEQKNIYGLVKQECAEIMQFWKETIAEYERTQLDDCIKEVKSISDSFDSYATWPSSTPLTIGHVTYDYYFFQSPKEEDYEYEFPEENAENLNYDVTPPDIPDSFPIPEDGDLGPTEDDPQEGETSIKDFKYWARYFSLATVISIPFLNCGLDIPPFVWLVPFPCIFICIGCVYIKMFDIVIVFGISVRGMYVWPIVLFVNLSNQYASITTPLIGMLKTIQATVNAKIEALMELPINSLATSLMQTVENDSQRLRRENKQLEVSIAAIKAKKVANHHTIKKNIERIFKPNAKQTQQVIDPLNSD